MLPMLTAHHAGSSSSGSAAVSSTFVELDDALCTVTVSQAAGDFELDLAFPEADRRQPASVLLLLVNPILLRDLLARVRLCSFMSTF